MLVRLTDQPIGVLIAAPLPGVMRGGKVEGHTRGLLDGIIGMELGTVVGGDGLESSKTSGSERSFF